MPYHGGGYHAGHHGHALCTLCACLLYTSCARLGSSKVLHTEHFGRQTGAALRVPPRQAQAAAEGRNVDISPVNLQKAFVYLAGEREDAPC